MSTPTLADVADFNNLATAFGLAATGKADRPDVVAFRADLNAELSRLGVDIRAGVVDVGRFRRFRIFDPKPRTIHAPVFRERVLHHALMRQIGPVLDRALIFDTYACRWGKGALAAVHRAQHHLRRFPFFVKVDVRAYFDSVDHVVLVRQLERRIADPGIRALCSRIIGAYETSPGRGLPIGALTSQHFANQYLGPLDRFLLEELKVAAMVRYMDDSAWWCQTKAEAWATLRAVTRFVPSALKLALHPHAYVQRSQQGLSFLGFRIFAGRLYLSARRRQRFRRAVRAWEGAYRRGLIDAPQLQRGMDSALAIVQHADAKTFLTRELRRGPSVDA